MKVDNSTQKSETHISYTDYDSNSEARLAKRETFLWVNAQDETDPNYTTEGVKQSFIRKRSNRLRRENQLQTLKASVKPFPKGRLLPGPNMSSTLDREEQQADKKDRKALVCHNMQAGLLEAFPSLPTNTNRAINFYYHHYRVFAAHHSFPLSSTVISVWFFQEALNQPALVETLLFLSAASHTATLKMIDTSPYSIQRSMQDTLQLRSRALKSLQSNLVNPIMAFSEATILVITHLLCIECAQANIEAVEAHMAGLQQIINALGGLERLDIRTLSTIYCCDAMKGIILDTPPIFEISKKWEAWIRENSICMKMESPSPSPSSSSSFLIGTRFFSSSWSKDLSEELVSIIKGFQRLIPCHEQLVKLDSRYMPAENDYLLFLFHQLYSLPSKVMISPLQGVLCLSLQVYGIVRIWEWYRKPCLQYSARILQQRIENCYALLKSTAADLLFWTLFLGALLSTGIEVHAWFIKHLKECAESMHLVDSSQAVPILEEFFFVYRQRDEPASNILRHLFPSSDMKN